MSKVLRSIAVGAALLTGAACSSSLTETASAPTQVAHVSAAERCAAIAATRLEHVEITRVSLQAANAPVDGAVIIPDPRATGPLAANLPEFCRVAGAIQPEAGSDIRFEVWLPSGNWDGRLHGFGIGGFAGIINYMDLASAIRAGTVGTATDTGHRGTMEQSDWARGRPELIRDYGWRAIHLTTVAAKEIVERFYGREAEHSYFMGCSGGGRQGLMEAARFPDDYDGIVSGAPAAVFSTLVMSWAWSVQTQMPAGAALRAEQIPLLQSEVLAQCDALDGQADSVVANPRACRFDASKLACGVSSSPQCFSPPQLSALRQIHAGPRDASGRQLARGFLPSGAEAGTPIPSLGWEGFIVRRGVNGPSGHSLLSRGILQDFAPTPGADEAAFDYDRDPARLRAAVGHDLDAEPNLRRFIDRGGKLILWHGWADGAIAPEATIDFYAAALRASGRRAAQSIRLFMAPGLQHCFGGTGPTDFGQFGAPRPDRTPDRNVIAAMHAWVESDRAPDTLIGRQGDISAFMGGLAPAAAPGSESPPRQYLLCPYPSEPVLRAGGDPNSTADHACVRSSGRHR